MGLPHSSHSPTVKGSEGSKMVVSASTKGTPAIMATTSINDTRVFYVEPHKWVQRLRQATAQVPDQSPIVIRTEMVAGHAGASGRRGRWQARAQEFAFALHQVGITK